MLSEAKDVASSSSSSSLSPPPSSSSSPSLSIPDFPLLPVSRGFHLTLADLLESFRQILLNLKAEYDGGPPTVCTAGTGTVTDTAIAPKATIEETLHE